MIDYFILHSSAISFTIVVTGFLINLLLGIFVVLKKIQTKHLVLLAALFFSASASMLFEGLSYVSGISELGVWPMRILTVIVMWINSFLCVIFYIYLLSYYEYKQNAPIAGIYKIIPIVYALIFSVVYMLLCGSGLFFDVSPEGKYIVTEYSYLPFLLMLPMMLISLYAMFKGRKLTDTSISICFVIFVIIVYLGGGIDSIIGISVNFLWRTIMNLILYYVLMRDQENELMLSIQTEQISRARSDFLTNMSHDIRTPMNAVLGFAELAKKDVKNPAIIKDYLDKISSSGNYLLSLINDVLDMSRIENDGVFLEDAPMDISATINEVETIVAGRMAQKNHHFTVECINLPNTGVLSDKLRINQVLVNILGNAIKYTDPGGEISLTVSALDNENEDTVNYVFVIKDNGIGMDEEYIKHIFEPFSRERSSTVSKQQGTGLGMAITGSIVSKIGGSISVDSHIGQGSTFTVKLPLKTCDISLVTSETKTEESHNFSGKRILLVEDNELNRIIAIKLLEDKDIIVEVAVDGKEALHTLQTKEACYYDAILMDIQMPVMDGYESTRAIRSLDSQISNIPIIAMTANAFKEDVDKAFEAGMNAYVKKPIDINELFSTLQKYI